MDKNWGQVKGGKLSTGTTKNISLPEKSEKLAELVGIILGDGNIHIFKGKKSTSYMIRIAGDSNKDKEYLINYVKPLCDNLFGIESKLFKHKKHNELFVNINSKKVVEFLLSIGMKQGNKIKSQTTIPKWVFEKDPYLMACIRGLVDTDGSIYELKTHWPGLWQLCFTNMNETLLNDFIKAMKKLNIGCSKIYRYENNKGTPKIYITKKSDLKRYYEEIGFSNPKHNVRRGLLKPKIL